LKRRAKRKAKPKVKPNTIILVLLAVIVLVAVIYFLFEKGIIPSSIIPSDGVTPTVTQWNCEDMQIDVNSIKEAINYYRFGIARPATENFKFEILNLTVTNKANVTKDFSGHRMELLADNVSYIPVTFNEIEKITLIDNSVLDYPCRELALASISRFELNAGESSTGCKIFTILEDLSPTLLSIYNTTGLKCSIQI